MKPPESAITQSERHVREGEERITRQTALVERMDRAGHEHRAEQARQMLATLQQYLEIAREHLRIQCQMRELATNDEKGRSGDGLASVYRIPVGQAEAAPEA
jgi:hypothetical protein